LFTFVPNTLAVRPAVFGFVGIDLKDGVADLDNLLLG